MNKHYDHWLECEGDFEIVGIEQEEDFCWVLTSDSIFYVEGGGMAKDTGTINGIEVEDIRFKDGYYAHKIHGSVSGIAHMKVDVDQRIEKVQIHSASHLICGYINKKYHARTIAFFTHEDSSGCEMEFEEFNEDIMHEIEKTCNQYVLSDLPIQIVYPTLEEARQHAPEEKLEHDELRAAVIGDIDYNMCGCIHVPSLRYLQSIKLLSYEKTTRGYKIYFICGEQLLRTLGKQQTILEQCAKDLGTPQNDIYLGITRLRQEIKDLKAIETEWKNKVVAQKIKEFAAKEEVCLSECIEDLDVKTFQMLCSTLVREHEKAVFFVCHDADRCHVMIARHASLPFKANELFKEIAVKFSLRGGGNPAVAQGGGSYQPEILEELAKLADSMNHII